MGTKSGISKKYAFLDSLIEGCQVINKDFQYVYLNDAAIGHANKPREDLIGTRMMDAYPGIDQTDMFAALKRVMQSGQSEEMDNEFTYLDGSTGWFHLRIQPVEEGILVLSDDVTERRMARKSLEVQVRRLDALRQIDLAIMSTVDLSVLSKLVLDQTTEVLEVDAGIIHLLDPDSLFLKPLQTRGLLTPYESTLKLQAGQGILGRVALERKSVYIEDLQANEDFTRKDLIVRERFASYLATPLASAGSVIGVLELFQRQKGKPDPAWFEFFEILAGQVALAISHVQNIDAMHRANTELTLAYDRTIEGWAKTLELRDIETEGHSERVTELAEKLASRLDYPEKDLVHVRWGARLHDIGKIGIPDEILFKPGELTEDEWVIMKRHPTIAFDLLSQIDFLKPALVTPRYHHEKWDGTGYPAGLRGDLIPEPARIFAIVDVWDALLSDRPYRKAWTKKKTLDYIKEQREKHFDPQIVDVFLSLVSE